MLLGFDLPTRGALASPETIARLAIEGEAMGFDYVTLSDHIVIPQDIDARYPYSTTGEFPSGGRRDWYEQLTSATFVAAKTTRLRMVTSVMVVPHRPAVLTAKMLGTIDLFSNGRLTVGIGAGWMKEEFEAVDAPPFAERGAVTDEYLAAFRELWTKDDPRFDGRYVHFSDIVMAPKPVQKPHPPIWVGGDSDGAFRRVVALGDGWHASGKTPAEMRDRIPRLRALAEAAGRPWKSLTVSLRLALTDELARQGAQAITDLFGEYQRLGLSHLMVDFRRDDLGRMLELLELIATKVRPAVAA